MKIKSIPHIWPILAGIVMLAGPFGLTIGVLIKLHNRGEIIPTEGYLPLGVFSTLGFWFLLLGIYFIKILVITNDNLKIIFPFRFRKYSYKPTDVIKYYTYENYGRFKNYESFHFQIIDGNIFMISEFEYFNYKRMKSFIESNSKSEFITKNHNGKAVLMLFLLSLLMTTALFTIFNLFFI
jgi:hypothetical protein